MIDRNLFKVEFPRLPGRQAHGPVEQDYDDKRHIIYNHPDIVASVAAYRTALSYDGRFVAITTHERDLIVVIRVDTGVVNSIPCSAQPFGITFSPNSEYLFVGFAGGRLIP